MVRLDLVTHRPALRLRARFEPARDARSASASSGASPSRAPLSADAANPVRGAAPGALRETDQLEGSGEKGCGLASASSSEGKARCPDSTPGRASPSACPTATIRAFNSCKEVQSTCASLDNRTLQQAARSNLQPGTSMHRALRSGDEPHRNIRSPPLTITSCTKTRSPNHGCQGYRSSKQSVTWALRRRVLQRSPNASLLAQGCPDQSTDPADRADHFSARPRWSTPSILSDVVSIRDRSARLLPTGPASACVAGL